MISNITEGYVIRMWQQLLLNRRELTTEDGEPIRIIYPGRSNDDLGADFCDALANTRYGLTRGDIEVHVKSSYWHTHGHDRNPAYNRVVLHVVMWHDSRTTITLQNGKAVPTLALQQYATEPSRWSNPGGRALNIPCFETNQDPGTGTTERFIDSAGEERFLAKANRFQNDISQIGPGQSLYEGTMVALGYAKNKLPFLELARRLPLRVLRHLSQRGMPDEECLARQQALLLGTAGLLPSQHSSGGREIESGDEWVDRLEKLWSTLAHSGPMSAGVWHLFKVRPNNHPVRRLAAMSYLILRYKERSMLEEMANLVKESPNPDRLVEALQVTGEGYWTDHYDFGPASRLKSKSLLGRDRAAEIAVDVILPFAFAWGKYNSRPEVQQKSTHLYHSFPRLMNNTVEQHMANQLKLDRGRVNSARRQQGLIQIYNTLCTQGKCSSCRLRLTSE